MTERRTGCGHVLLGGVSSAGNTAFLPLSFSAASALGLHRRAVASGAFLGRGLVEQHLLAVNQAGELVALVATGFLVGALKGEGGPLVMIEKGRPPFRAVMTANATGNTVLGKLLPMDIPMTLLALGRGSLKIHVRQPGFKVGRLVAIRARGCAMGPDQRERGLRMVEARHLFP